MPFSGIDRLKAEAARCQDGEAIMEALVALEAAADWNGKSLPAAQWPESLAPLLALALPPDNATIESARLSRARAAAIASVRCALGEGAAMLGDEPAPFQKYWRHAWMAIRGGDLRLASNRRDAVALMDVYEARQWELPVVFVAGLLEGEFPRHPGIEPILPNDLRIRARQSGVLLRTREGRDQEERFLFSLARSRATQLAVLSYPQFDAKGEATLPSFELASIDAELAPAQPVLIRPSRPAPAAPPTVLASGDARTALRRVHETHSGTALETFLSCPFVYFSRHSLDLDEAPARPVERLDMLVLGSLVHAVIVEWHKRGGPVERIFESHWERLTRKLRVPPGYHAEFERLRALRALRHYAADPKIDAGFQASFEQAVKVTLDSGEVVKGRIDRYDIDEEGNCRVIDFKYSRASKLDRLKRLEEAGALLQLGIYLAAVSDMGYEPQAAAYVPLRSAEAWKFKGDAAEMIQSALDRASNAAARILDGVIAPNPAIDDVCEYCEMKSACRITEMKRRRAAFGAA
jgi:ATP-dependent helicase/DNAse subunit B